MFLKVELSLLDFHLPKSPFEDEFRSIIEHTVKSESGYSGVKIKHKTRKELVQ